MVKKIMVFDPGESTGWVFRDEQGRLTGGTFPRDHSAIRAAIDELKPDILVWERFNLYPGMARALSWNSFYPCEVIGVLRLTAQQKKLPVAEQAPSVKKYAGPLGEEWTELRKRLGPKATEHTKDAYQHYRFFTRYDGKGKRG